MSSPFAKASATSFSFSGRTVTISSRLSLGVFGSGVFIDLGLVWFFGEGLLEFNSQSDHMTGANFLGDVNDGAVLPIVSRNVKDNFD